MSSDTSRQWPRNQPNQRLRRKTCRSKATAGLLLQEQFGVSAPAFQVAPFPRPVGSCGGGNGRPFLRLRRLGRSNEDGSKTRGRYREEQLAHDKSSLMGGRIVSVFHMR